MAPLDLLLVQLLDWYDEERLERDVFAPIGPSYIAARIEADGYRARVEVRRCQEEGGGLTDLLERLRPRVLGLSATGNEIPVLKRLSREVRARFPSLPQVAGGYCSLKGDALFRGSSLDVVVYGEGEETMAELLPLLLEGRVPRSVEGLLYRDPSGRVCRNPPRAPVPELDALPPPDYPHIPENPRLIRVYASRGCPFKCTFCEIKDFYPGGAIRHHGAEYVSELVERLLRRSPQGVRHLYFNDDEFLLYRGHLAEMASVARRFGLGMVFQTRVGDVIRHRSHLAEHRDVIHEVHTGVESFSAGQLERWRKMSDPDKNRRALEVLAELGISYYPYMILTDAETTPAELEETCRGLLELPPCPVTVGAGEGNLRPVMSPLRRGMHFNRLKTFEGQIERDPSTDYLEAVWRFMERTSAPASTLSRLYVSARGRMEDPSRERHPRPETVEAVGRHLDRRIALLPELARAARDRPGAEGERSAEAEARNFVEEARLLRLALLTEGLPALEEEAGATGPEAKPREHSGVLSGEER